jgi:hypothetical protein
MRKYVLFFSHLFFPNVHRN